MKHIVESQQFDKATIKSLFSAADSFSKLKTNPLRGKIMASLFYEPSTRTRFSFESAMLRLGGGVLSTENAREFSSVAKGETLEDSIRIMNYYSDVIVLRHPEQGAADRAIAVSDIPIINAGDGQGQHPTQALLDLYTIQKEIGAIDGIHIAMVGDLKHGRTIHSLAYLLGKYDDVYISFISPKQLGIGSGIKDYLNRHGAKYEEVEAWDKAIGQVDAIYQTRIQKERFKSPQEYKKFKGKYVLTMQEVNQMKKHSIIMHPLPRVDEIATEVDSSSKAVYFQQAKYGLWVRMALLQALLQ